MTAEIIVPEDMTKPPSTAIGPVRWARENLFNGAMNSVITLVLGTFTIWALIKGVGWIINEDWAIVRANLRNFVIGQFDREALWRPWTSGFVILGAAAVGSAALARRAYETSLEVEMPTEKPSWRDLLNRFWPLLAFAILMASFAQSWLPRLGVLVAVAVVVAGRFLGWRAPSFVRQRAEFLIALGVIVGLALLAGTHGLLAVVAGIWAAAVAARELDGKINIPGIAGSIVSAAAPLVIGVVVGFAVTAIPFEGNGWDDWGGMHLTLFATIVGIGAGLPIGILLAIGRASNLPIIKTFCVLFIEFIRGVPLIALLLASNFILPLLFPPDAQIPGGLSRAMIVITLFTSAYIAEIVRGGLQAVPKGQTEAAQAAGMSAGRIQRLIVMPQALRAVIPAMVGQFISLFKDTSLLSIIAVPEWFAYSSISNSQTEFLGKGLQLVTYTIVAIGYWSFAYTMSKESRRLEQKLGVGVR